MEILRKIGFNEYNALVSIFNFFLAYAVLAKYMFPALKDKIEERKKKIEQIELKEKTLETYVHTKQTEANEIVEEAHLRADKIISNALAEAERNKSVILTETKAKIIELEKKHKEELNKQKTQMIKDARNEIIELSSKISEKIIGPKITEDVNQKLLEDLVQLVEKELDTK